jgi:hypothetical protein
LNRWTIVAAIFDVLRHCVSSQTRHALFCAGMTMARGNSAPAPQRPSDCVSAMSMETYIPTVTFTRPGSAALNGVALVMTVAQRDPAVQAAEVISAPSMA